MTIEFTTTITGMEAYPVYQEVPLYVFRVYWNYLGADEKFSTAMQGSTDVPASDPQSATPYAELTEEQVMGWVQTYTPSGCGQSTQTRLQLGLQRNIHPQL